MKRLFYLALAIFSFQISIAGDDWGRTGHRATGEIAEQYLSPKAKKAILELINGQSLALVSTYADDIKSNPDYRKFNPWHYVNIDEDESEYNREEAHEAGDLVQAIETSISVLKDEEASKEDKQFYLKMLVHFMGDLHQPFHVGRSSDKGGNDIQLRWFNEGTNIHRVWDSQMINSYQMSYTEIDKTQKELSYAEIKNLEEGELLDWVYESRDMAEKLYDSVEIGEKLGYQYMYEWFPTLLEQLQKGGVRLAKVLNEIYE